MNARVTSLAPDWNFPVESVLVHFAGARRGGSGPREPHAGRAQRRALAEERGGATHASSRGRRRRQRTRIEHDSRAAVGN